MLRSVDSQRRFGTIYRSHLEHGKDRVSLIVGNYQSMLCNVPEERKYHLHRRGSLKSCKIFKCLFQQIAYVQLIRIYITQLIVGRVAQSVQRLTTGWTVRGSNHSGARFSARPDRLWGPPSLLYNRYRVFPGGKIRPGRAADHSHPSSTAVVEQESYTSTHTLGHNRACNGSTLTFLCS